jgi:hypothetical protein
MEFPFGETAYRDRRAAVPSEHNPDRTTLVPWPEPGAPEPWEGIDTIELPGAWVASSSSTAVTDATRSSILTNKSLFSTDPSVDVRALDRIRVGGQIWYVRERPEADRNPFTGWQPVVEIPLEMTEG